MAKKMIALTLLLSLSGCAFIGQALDWAERNRPAGWNSYMINGRSYMVGPGAVIGPSYSKH